MSGCEIVQARTQAEINADRRAWVSEQEARRRLDADNAARGIRPLFFLDSETPTSMVLARLGIKP